MDILICISHVPDTTTKIKFTNDGSSLDASGVSFVINPYDEFGLARALELNEAGTISGRITILCVGTADVDPTIRKALAVGGEKAVRINLAPTDAFEVAQQIAGYLKEDPHDIVMMGKESIDNNGSQVPGMVASLLDWSFVSFATSLEIENGTPVLTREIDGGQEVLEVQPPFVLSAQKGLAEWRIPNMRGIMQARRKPLEVKEPYYTGAKTEAVQYELPPPKSETVYIEPENMDKLVTVLAEKGIL